MYPILQIGPVAIQLPGLVILMAVWTGIWLAERRALRLGLPAEALTTLAFTSLVAGVIGARVGHVFQHGAAYQADPWAILALTPATLWAEAGLAVGLVTALVLGQRQGLRLRPSLDALAPALAVFAAGLSAANFLSGEAFGAPAAVPWAVSLWGAMRHPVQLYEMAAALAVLALTWFGPWRADLGGRNGLLALAGLAASRVFLEAFRGDSVVWAGGWRANQVGALVILVVALAGLRVWTRPSAAPHPADADSLDCVQS